MGLASWLNRRVAPLITALGVTPRSVTLEVRGRRSGKPIRLSVSPSDLDGRKYLVSLAGEQPWVKNLRAADGEAFIILKRRAFTRSAKQAARLYFGLETPTLRDMQGLAARFPVFRIEEPTAVRPRQSP